MTKHKRKTLLESVEVMSSVSGLHLEATHRSYRYLRIEKRVEYGMDVSNLPLYRNDGPAYRIKEGQTRTVLLPDSMRWLGFSIFQ
jgi:hypothetical protein